jgi:Pyridoxamine 5'-phosphate oxidase
MTTLAEIAEPFITMAHRIVWCTVATVTRDGKPRTRVLHPFWQYDGERMTGWILTSPGSPKAADLDAHPQISLTYWDPTQDTCSAECNVVWELDDVAKRAGWKRFAEAPAPVGYNPAIIPPWTSPEVEAFGVLRLEPYRLRLMDGSLMATGKGSQLRWKA